MDPTEKRELKEISKKIWFNEGKDLTAKQFIKVLSTFPKNHTIGFYLDDYGEPMIEEIHTHIDGYPVVVITLK